VTDTPRKWKHHEPLTLAEIDLVIRLGKNNFTPVQCLKVIGRDQATLEHLARVTDIEAAGICELRRAGWSYRKIRAVTGRNGNTIAKVIAVDLGGSRKSAKAWRCPGCGGLVKLQTCEGCRVSRMVTSQRDNARAARRYGYNWWRKLNGLAPKNKF